MEKLTIRRANKNDIEEMVEIWYQASILAHSFIPVAYWDKNKDSMEKVYLPNSENYIAFINEHVLGFMSLKEEHLAALFIRPEYQRKGIGKVLLNHAKNSRSSLRLNVYTKNLQGVNFYVRNGFSIVKESQDINTGEQELMLEWSESKY